MAKRERLVVLFVILRMLGRGICAILNGRDYSVLTLWFPFANVEESMKQTATFYG